MSFDLRFQVLVLPSLQWPDLIARYQRIEALGFDMAVVADHFVDWTKPSNPWFEAWTMLSAVAHATSTLRIGTGVAQIPLRSPAMLARQALTVDHVSNGRLEIGLGLGLTIDPSYAMMGIPNWSNKERAARFPEYVELLDQLLSNEVTTYQGRYYEVDGTIMNPRPVQSPRPPITIAAMGPVMLENAAKYADTWNSMSFLEDLDAQFDETAARVERVTNHCKALNRSQGPLRHSYNLFDAVARHSGGNIRYYETPEAFADQVRRFMTLGITDFGLYYPTIEQQMPVFETIASEVIPELKRNYRSE